MNIIRSGETGWTAVVIYTILAILPMTCKDNSPCPDYCKCYFKDEKAKIVSCTNKQLTAFPRNFPVDTTEIHAEYNDITTLSVNLSYISNLTHLNLARNQIANISGLLLSEHLKYLNVSHNLLTETTISICGVHALKVLDLSHNKIHDLRKEELQHFPALVILLLKGNLVSQIRKSSFASQHEGGFRLLKKLSVAENKIESIQDESFKNFASLQALSLANNKISFLTNKTFLGLDNVKYLDLSYNTITKIENGTFSMMKAIKYIYLNHNKLQAVPYDVPMAEWLDLSGNWISSVSEAEKETLYTSEFFNLAYNPLHCDCKLLWLKELWDRREHLVKHFDNPSDFIPRCGSPKFLFGESWDQLGDDVFKCVGDTDDHFTTGNVNLEAFQTELSNMVKQQRKLDIRPVLVATTTDTITITCELTDGYTFEPRSLEVKYHKFGNMHDEKKVTVSFDTEYVILEKLESDTGYLVCLDLVQNTKDMITPLNQCIEVTTEKNPYVLTVNITFLVIISSLILKILGSIIFTISFIGLAAVVLGALTSQSKSWSSDLTERELLQGSGEECLKQTQSFHKVEGASNKIQEKTRNLPNLSPDDVVVDETSNLQTPKYASDETEDAVKRSQICESVQ